MLHVVTGPPASGKTTFIAHNAMPGDIRIDLDHIANLIAGNPLDGHDHDGVAVAIARAGRRAMIEAAFTHCHDVDVWLIHTAPKPDQLAEYQRYGATIHEINPGKDVVMQRCKAERPPESLKVAARWFDYHDPGAQSKQARRRKYGHSHRKRSERMRRNLVDGTPCSWCGREMTREMELHADHDDPSKPAGELLHAACNEQKGDGRDWARRPALGVDGGLPALPIRFRDGRRSRPGRDDFMADLYKGCP